MGILNGKIAIITGAGYGVGEGIATAYAKEGATIVAAAPVPHASVCPHLLLTFMASFPMPLESSSS